MTPEQEREEKERFEKAWSIQINLSPSPIWDELNEAIKQLCLTYWLERAKEAEEEIEKLKNSLSAIEDLLNIYCKQISYACEKEMRRILGE